MIACTNQTMTYDLNNILSVMITCTATFVAIIGGLIASKTITDRAEKDYIDRKLPEIDLGKAFMDMKISNLNELLIVRNVEDFINKHIDALIGEENLSDVYDADDNKEITEEELLPYWKRAIEAVRKFKENIDQERNKDKVPIVIIDKLDAFQYKICSAYSNSIEQGEADLFETSYLSAVAQSRSEKYNEKVKELEDKIAYKKQLIIKENILIDKKQDIMMSKPVIKGISIFVLVSMFCIIMPLIFMLFNPTSSFEWYKVEILLSFSSFIVGILAMIIYICSWIPQKRNK